MRLADVQTGIAHALITRTLPACDLLLMGGRDPRSRFAIHSRHYMASLAGSLVERFAATVWLAGSELVTRAAMAFVQDHPPRKPCIAEYGDDFPMYLTTRAEVARLPYLAQFATLDWHLGRLAVAVDAPPLAALADCDLERIAVARLILQPGIEYLRLDWSVDELMSFYLSSTCPEQYAIRHEPVWLELGGCRGELSINRLTESNFTFRHALAQGMELGEAAELAMKTDDRFDPGAATLELVRARLITRTLFAEVET